MAGPFPSSSGAMSRLPDGRYVPARPIPYFRDTRPFYVKLWHSWLTIKGCFIRDRVKREAYEDRLEERMDKWMVAVEPYTDEQGNWRHW